MSKNHKSNLRRFAIYPDFWKPTWGRKPCLGIILAESEFHACRRAYDVRRDPETGAERQPLVRLNYTFGPEAVEVSKEETFQLRGLRRRKQ